MKSKKMEMNSEITPSKFIWRYWRRTQPFQNHWCKSSPGSWVNTAQTCLIKIKLDKSSTNSAFKSILATKTQRQLVFWSQLLPNFTSLKALQRTTRSPPWWKTSWTANTPMCNREQSNIKCSIWIKAISQIWEETFSEEFLLMKLRSSIKAWILIWNSLITLSKSRRMQEREIMIRQKLSWILMLERW